MGKRIGYGKIGRSMPLTLDKCGNLGGDVEMAAVVSEMARRHPNDTFVLIGRNTGENPVDVGLPSNIVNPWIEWGPELRKRLNYHGLNHPDLSIPEQFVVADIFKELTQDTFINLDNIVMWVGQHGTSNIPLPRIENPAELTKPQDWCAYYASFIFQGINAWRDIDPHNNEEIYLNADPRNHHKMRDLKWPLLHPVLTQFNFTKRIKHERYVGDKYTAKAEFEEYVKYYDSMRNAVDVTYDHAENIAYEHDGSLWRALVRNVYSRLEVNGLIAGSPFGDLIQYNDDWSSRDQFGLFINEAGRYGVEAVQRLHILKNWILPLDPAWIHGTWSKQSLAQIDRDIKPASWDQYYPRLHSIRTTLTTPSSGSGWATAKPWEAFAAGTVCFFHPKYDIQDNILGDADSNLRSWLRVSNVSELRARINHLNSHSGRRDWEWLVREQRCHFEKAITELTYMRMIESRIYR